MESPPHALYASVDELLQSTNAFASAHGYKLVVVRSKTNNQNQKTWIQLACDRHGTKRNTHNLTDETRKKHRRSRRCECPMYCVASRSANTGMWEISVRNAEHNHGPYEPTPKKKKDMPPQHSSELVNLPLVQTPSYCTADFCLLPIGTGNPSVSREIAEVQRLLKRSGLTYDMNSGGTSVEGSWDDVMRIIGQAHSLLHGDGNGVVRIQTTIRVGTRMDKKQTGQDKLASVHALLNNEPLPRDTTDNGLGHDDPSEVHDHSQHLGQAMGPGSMPQIAPGLDSVGVPPPPTMGQPMAHHVHPQLPPHFNQRMPHMHLGHGTGL